MDTPQSLGYRWPAEWEPHAATWIAWPHNVSTWPGRFAPIPSLFVEIIRILAQYEPVHVLAGGLSVMNQAQELVGNLTNVSLFDIPTDDAWVRDYGPLFIQSGDGRDLAGVDWQFNSWGEKYPPFALDNAAGEHIMRSQGIRRFPVDAVLEGGSIDGNGDGTILTTTSCLLDPGRNRGVTRECMEGLLRTYLSAKDFIWIAGGPLAGDDTDGHVDQLARFVAPAHVLVAVSSDPADENHRPLQTNLKRLEAYRQRQSVPLEITPLPTPRPLRVDGQRVPASYCNFYIANGCVLVPLFDDRADAGAMDTLRTCFPDRDVIGIPAGDLVWGLGALHCMTRQQPAIP